MFFILHVIIKYISEPVFFFKKKIKILKMDKIFLGILNFLYFFSEKNRANRVITIMLYFYYFLFFFVIALFFQFFSSSNSATFYIPYI